MRVVRCFDDAEISKSFDLLEKFGDEYIIRAWSGMAPWNVQHVRKLAREYGRAVGMTIHCVKKGNGVIVEYQEIFNLHQLRK